MIALDREYWWIAIQGALALSYIASSGLSERVFSGIPRMKSETHIESVFSHYRLFWTNDVALFAPEY